jgi:diguanylate cyclase (GGDEF)-like protein
MSGNSIDKHQQIRNLLQSLEDPDVTQEQALQIARTLGEFSLELYDRLMIDPLTGVSSHEFFLNEIVPELSVYYSHPDQRRKDSKDYIIFVIDLNDLRVINNELGHAAGDEALRTLASILKASVRKYDWVVRHGDKSDEFMVVVKVGTEDTEELKDVIQDRISVTTAALSTDIQFAVGYAYASHYSSVDEVTKAADDAMYENKRVLKHNTIVIDDEIDITE